MKFRFLVLAKDLETEEKFEDTIELFVNGEDLLDGYVPTEEDVVLAFYKSYSVLTTEIIGIKIFKIFL